MVIIIIHYSLRNIYRHTKTLMICVLFLYHPYTDPDYVETSTQTFLKLCLINDRISQCFQHTRQY